MSANGKYFSALALIRRKYGLFTERGLALYSVGIAAGLLISLASQLHTRGNGFERNGNCVDFMWIWLSSHFAASNLPVRIFDQSAFIAAKEALIGPPACILEHYDYPPTFLLFSYPLHLFPFGVAFVVWVTATLAVYLLAVYAIIPHRNALIVACMVFPAWINIFLGHDGFLTAGFMGLALVFVETRPLAAGLFLALLTYKPQFGLLFPPALAVSRNWRVLTAGAIASVALFAVAVFAFGYDMWPGFVRALIDRAAALRDDRAMAAPLVSVLYLLSLGVNSHVVWTIQLMIFAVATATVCFMWARPYPFALKAAAFATGSVIASPHVISYDLCVLTIGGAFFVRDELARGFRRGERTTLLFCWIALHRFTFGPIPLLVCMTLFILIVLRAIHSPIRRPSLLEGVKLEKARV